MDEQAATLDRIEKTIRYWTKHYADLERVATDLARKMSIDPAYDIVLVREDWVKKSRLSLVGFPKWMMLSTEIKSDFEIIKGVRNKGAK